jgi:hypothetical protein
MNKLMIGFEKGGTLIGILNERAPQSVKSIMEILPIRSTIFHTRWCGREISLGIQTNNKAPLENFTNTVSKFDIAYWRDWDGNIPDAPVNEALAFYYGPELLRCQSGLLITNVIGRILWEQEELLEQIGARIWEHGTEKVLVEAYKD